MEQEALQTMVRDVLGDRYRAFEVTQYILNEDMREGRATIVCQLRDTGAEERYAVEGTGVGMIDALFNGFKRALHASYPSLDHIHFVSFVVEGDFSQAQGSASDAPGRVRLAVENTSGRVFEFTSNTTSISASSVGVVVKAVEHFVNAELAVGRVYEWIEDAKRRHRPDLAEKYTHRLADLVMNASYSESLERLKQSVGVG